MKRAFLFVSGLLLSASLLSPTAALAEEETVECHADVCLEVRVLQVRVPRPSAFYVINRQQLRSESSTEQQSFTQDLVESVDQNPF